ncbi:MAG TPA: DsrE/DsrF/DrsH-like family protein, partial [Tenuifilaceae bacterium]|nr:DsrE/DsrF/DrsH-like family protein [Tenuifilaceae bacterium]
MANTIDHPIKKVMIICAKASIEDVYAALVMANGAVMEGIEAKVFFTFFGLDAITKKQMKKLHTGTVGNPGMRMPGGLPFPTILGILPGVEAGVSAMMKSQMEKLDI